MKALVLSSRLLAPMLVAGVAACANFDMPDKVVNDNMDRLASVNVTGVKYTDTLVDEYRQLAKFEQHRMKDERDANRWALKGLDAARTGDVPPEDPRDWDLPSDARKDIEEGHAALTALRSGPARDVAPDSLAKAQTSFDCWVEQSEENYQPKHIENCRKKFWHALRAAETSVADASKPTPAPKPKPAPSAAPAPVAPQPVRMELFFDFDSATLRKAHDKDIAATVALHRQRTNAKIVIEGHADRVGSTEYNRRLSAERARVVMDRLVAEGVSPGDIEVRWEGETEPLIKTGDGVRNERNRRVEIYVE